ncbi:tetratricopeptide repeat protein [uncultured Bacteroides sp.]|uniref:tetratricopeptide repeat protein n=1 Tax=uncultured Bacteroides sp. TaxID=162156 RepID=UPI00280B7CA6|nr:tetratricopeptide repeat protein [uncultured Bacteroides sp.]
MNIRKFTLILTCCGTAFQMGFAQELPKWANKARKAVFSVVTYDKDNQILNTGNGFYIDENGTGVSDYTLFKGAERAVVVTAEGKELPVEYILGANDMYDVVKFKTASDKKIEALQPTSRPGTVNETVYVLPYSTQKATTGTHGTIAKIDTISHNSFYYTLNMKTGDKTVSCPVMNAEGEVIGLVQKNGDKENTSSYAIGIGYAKSLSISALSANDFALNTIGIRKGLPEDESQALVYVYMASSNLTQDEYLNLLNEFIQKFPKNSEGYSRRATCYIGYGDDTHYALAEKDLEAMIEVSDNKGDAYYNRSKLLYNYVLGLQGAKPYGDWTLERALKEINTALESDKQGLYYQLQGDIYFAMQKYPEAFASYEEVNRSPLASAATYYAAAKTKELIEGASKKEAIALMDSAVAKYNPPYGKDAAPYLFERARMKAEDNQFREAVADYNLFYDAMMGQVSAEFYSIREQAEMQCRMYQQAINDINQAIEMEPKNANYWAEKGGVHLRVNQLTEAIEALNKAIELDAQNSAAYRMLGYCQLQQNKKKEGLANLEKAVKLGDTVAKSLLEKYNK